MPEIWPVVTGVVKEIQNNVGQLTGVRSIILSGGGAALYAPAIRKAFPIRRAGNSPRAMKPSDAA